MSKNFVRAMTAAGFNANALNPAAFLPINIDFGGNPRATLTEACFLIRVINASNVEVFISYDGVNYHDHVPAGLAIQLPFQNNSSPNNYVAIMPKNSMIYVRGNVGIGFIAVAGYYQEG